MTRSSWTLLAVGAALVLLCGAAFTAVQVYRVQPHATLNSAAQNR